MARYIGFTVFKNGGDIRDVMSVGKLIRKADGPQEVEWIINTMTKYGAKSENAILDLFEEFLFKMPRLYYGPF
jgi:hypothetical protein